MKAYEPGLTIEITKNSDFCEDNGAAKIITKNIENAKYKVEYEGLAHPISGDVSASGIVILENLPGSSPIHLEINGSNISTISRTFTVETILPGSIENLTYEVSGYTEERIEYHDERNGDGNIKFTYNAFADGNIWGVGLVDYGLTVEQKYNAKIIRNSNYTGTTAPSMDEFNVLSGITDASDLNDKLIYAWWGNRVYTIVVWYYCDNSDSIREWGKGEELIEMPEDLDIVFDDYPYATYNHMIRPLIERYPNSSEVIKKVWPNILLTSDSLYLGGTKMREFKQTLKSLPYFSGNSEVLYDTMYHVKRALFYRESQSSIGSAYGTIDFNVVGGTPPYTIKIAYGEGEKVINGTSLSTLVISGFSSSEAAADAGYSLSVNGFISPTAIFDMSTWLPVTETTTVKVDCPFDKGYFTDYAKVFSSGSTTEILPTGYTAKSPYHISIRDSRNKSISLWLPSIYRPFFMRALYFSYCQLNSSNAHKNEQKFAFAVANPLSPTVTPLMKIKHGWVSGAVTSSVTYSSQYAEYNGGINIPTGWTENYTAVSSNRAYVEKNYLTLGGYRSNSNRMITSGDYSVSMFEDGRTGATASIEKNVYVHFIGDGAGLYSPQVQYMPIDNDLANMIKRSEFGESSLPVTDNFIKPYTWTEEYGNWIPYTGFGPNKLKVSTSTSTSNAVMAPLSQFVWTPNLSVWIATNAGLIEGDNTKVYLDDNQVSKQRAAITIEDMLSENYETALSGINDHVLAIYESDDKCVYPETSAQAKEPIMMGAFYYMTENGTERHISNVTVLRLYTKEAFIKYVGETFHST